MQGHGQQDDEPRTNRKALTRAEGTAVGFDITFLKPKGQEAVPNRVWATMLLDACPELAEVECDHEAVAQEHASDINISPAEYLARGIGIQLESPEEPDWWMILGLWDACVILKLPNFSPKPIPVAIAATSQIRTALRGAGFTLENPKTGDLVQPEEEDQTLLEAYSERQRMVAHVAKLVGGTAPGLSQDDVAV